MFVCVLFVYIRHVWAKLVLQQARLLTTHGSSALWQPTLA